MASQQGWGWGKERGSHDLEDMQGTLCTITQNLVTWLELAVREKLGNRVYFVWLGVQLKIRGFISVQEGENGYEGPAVVSVTNEDPMCEQQYSSWCEDSIGTDMVSPTRLQAP